MTFPEGDLSAPENAWLKNFDLEKFTKEIADLGKVRKTNTQISPTTNNVTSYVSSSFIVTL